MAVPREVQVITSGEKKRNRKQGPVEAKASALTGVERGRTPMRALNWWTTISSTVLWRLDKYAVKISLGQSEFMLPFVHGRYRRCSEERG
jgi:hypothetical protein